MADVSGEHDGFGNSLAVAERKLRIQGWQLAGLVPDAVRNAAEPTKRYQTSP